MPERLKTDGQGPGRAPGDGRPRTLFLAWSGRSLAAAHRVVRSHLPAAVARADQALASIENGHLGAVPGVSAR